MTDISPQSPIQEDKSSIAGIIILIGAGLLLFFYYHNPFVGIESQLTRLVENVRTDSQVKDVNIPPAIPTIPPYEDAPVNIEQIAHDALDKKPTAELTQYQRWCIALGGFLTEINGMQHNQLIFLDKPLSRSMLNQPWNIRDHDSALHVLSWLGNEGHTGQDFKRIYLLIKEHPNATPDELARIDPTQIIEGQTHDEIVTFITYVKVNSPKSGDNLIYAWDYGRFVFVVRMAYSVGYLNQAESLALIEAMGKKVTHRFHSWQEFGDNYAMGRRWWALGTTARVVGTDETLHDLMEPGGAWATTPWSWSEGELISPKL